MTLIMKGWNEKLQAWRKYLQNTHLTKNLYSEYIKKLQNSALKNSHNKQVRKLATDVNSHFTNEELWTANLCVKRCSTSLALKEMQIQTPVGQHHTPTWTAKMSSAGEDAETMGHTGVENGKAMLENSLESFCKSKYGTSALEWLSRRNENERSHTNLFVSVHSSFIHNSPKLEDTQVSFN